MGIKASILAALLIAGPVWAEPTYHRVTGVAADDTLNIRSAPSADAEDIGDLAFDARAIEVITWDETGDWAQIALNERDGWVAARFLEDDDVPMFSDSGIPKGLVCGGTEPFWALGLYDVDARFSHPEDGEFDMTLSTVQVAEGRMGHPAFFDLAAPGGQASVVIQADICSDGMSDRSYGWAAFIRMVTPGTERFLSGCCHLPRD